MITRLSTNGNGYHIIDQEVEPLNSDNSETLASESSDDEQSLFTNTENSSFLEHDEDDSYLEEEEKNFDQRDDFENDCLIQLENETFSSNNPDESELEEQYEKEYDEDEIADPRNARTEKGIANHPLSKTAFLSGVGLVVVLVIGFIYTSFVSISATQPTASLPAPETTPTGELVVDPDVPNEAAARYKSELAFAEQTEANAVFNRQPKPVSSPTPSPIPPPVPHPRPVVVRPLPDLITPPAPISMPSLPVEPTLSPVEQWRMAAQMGSFGQVPDGSRYNSYTPTIPSVPVAPAIPAVPTIPAGPVAPTIPTQPVVPSSYNATNPGTLTIAQLRNNPTIPGMRSTPLTPVIVGTMVTGKLTTAIVLSEGDRASSSDSNATRYLISLTEPLKDSSGAIAIPPGTTLIAVVADFNSATGVIQLQTTSVLYNNQEYSLPDGALLIRSTDGGALQADRRSGGSGFARTVLPALFSGLGEAGRVIAQPQSTTTTTGGGTTTTSTDGQGNPGAAFMNGTFNSLGQQLQQQTQIDNQQASSRPSVWELDAGETVQIFVNTTFQM